MDIMSDSVATHVFFIYIFLSIMLFNLYSVYTMKNFMKLAKRLKYFTPLYHTINAIIIYTGMIVVAYKQEFSSTIFLMIASGIFLMVIEIKRFKKMRVIKLADKTLQDEFVIYAKKIYTIEISVLVFTYIISKLF